MWDWLNNSHKRLMVNNCLLGVPSNEGTRKVTGNIGIRDI